MTTIAMNVIDKNSKHALENLEKKFQQTFPNHGSLRFFSSPGRTEIAGNHTDHQLGKVIVAAVNLDTVAVVEKREDKIVQFHSEGFPAVEMSLDSLEKKTEETETSMALVRGVAKALVDRGYEIGGFNALISSQVPAGSGLSSSAAFELLMVSIFDSLYNRGTIDKLERAQIAQYAENVYFDKPSGLLDQSGSSFGDLIYIDFQEEVPVTKSLHLDLKEQGYRMLIVLTGGSHANLTPEYAAIPIEMQAVAQALGKNYLSELSSETFYTSLPEIRSQVGDRALLRAIHFLSEQERVDKMRNILEQDFDAFLDLVNQSGLSSELQLQNVSVSIEPRQQELALALALSRQFLADKKGACRVHGGGFAGTIQAYIREEDYHTYTEMMEEVFGEGSVLDVYIRPYGACEVLA